MTEPAITCLITDDHPAILASVATFLADEGIEIVGRARTGAEALALLERHQPTVALLDINLPDTSGIELARAIATSHPATATLLYTGYANAGVAHQALDAGAKGVVLKDSPLIDIARAVSLVTAGGMYLDPLLGGAIATLDKSQPRLTSREREILRLLSDGFTNEEMGAKLFLSPETVRTHVHKAVVRLRVRNRTQAVARALRDGLIS